MKTVSWSSPLGRAELENEVDPLTERSKLLPEVTYGRSSSVDKSEATVEGLTAENAVPEEMLLEQTSSLL